MKCKDGFDVLPFPVLWSNAGTTFLYRICDELIDDPQTLGGVQLLLLRSGLALFLRLGRTDSM